MVMTLIRIVVGFVFFGITTSFAMLLLVLLFPFRIARIKLCNYYGKIAGRGMMYISGCTLSYEGLEHLDASRPAIYVSNHSSIVDGFLAMFLSPVGTVGIVKKQILYYPFFGQLYFLSGHLRIDRSNPETAKKNMRELAQFVVDHGLSIFVWPEGTRSRSGRLQEFKKGVFHLAKQTGLPLVPVVVEGAHLAWKKGSMQINPVPIKITVLPPIDTSAWDNATMDQNLLDLQGVFAAKLPVEQRPAA